MKPKLTLALLLIVSAGVLAQAPYPLATDHYHLEISFDYQAETLQGICSMTITNHADTATSQIPLLLYRLIQVNAVESGDGKALNFTQSVVPFEDFSKQQVNYILVDYVIPPRSTRVIRIDYGGHLLGYAETGMRYITDRIDPEFTLIRMDAHAYPAISKPSFAFLVNNIRTRLFGYDIKVTVPDTLVVASGGRLQSKTPAPDNHTTWHYASKKPAWRIDIPIASYKQLATDGLHIFYLNDEDSATKIAQSGAAAVQQYAQWWGALQSPETVTIIETERGSGGQADELVILLPQESFSNISNYHDLYHELAHLWHVAIREEEGVSPRWEEGLAEFSSYLLNETLFEERAGLLKRAANHNLRRLEREFERNPALANVPMMEYGNQRITNLAYVQPMIMFALLYYWVGEEVFHNTMGGFYQEHAATGASTADLVQYWKQKAPALPLEAFFNDWIYSARFAEFVMDGKELKEIVSYYSQNNN